MGRIYQFMESKRIVFVGSRVNALGFKLSGIEDSKISEGRDAVNQIIKLIDSKGCDLIISEESILKDATNSEISKINSSISPLIILIPSEEINESETLESLAKRILGLDITKFE